MKLFKRFSYILFCSVLVFSLSICSFASSSGLSENEAQSADDYIKSQVFEASISSLSEMLKNGDITSVELCKVYLERIESFDKNGPFLNSILSINSSALAKARQMDLERKAGKVRGSLHGIPILVKDNIDVKGFPTTLGKSEGEAKKESAAAIKKLEEQGAIILGKTNLSTLDSETRYTASKLLGETRNAYDTEYSSGGSSGGCAVAVSANFAAASISTDTSFSLSYPAALNSVVAFRPTHNLIDYSGAYKINLSRDTIAPITRSVSDSALLLDALTGSDGTYMKALASSSLNGKTFLIINELSGYTYNNPNEFRGYDKEITEMFENTVKNLENLGATVKEISIPKLFTYYNACRESLKGSDTAKAKFKAELSNLLKENSADAFIFPSYLSSPLKSGFDKYGEHLSQNELYLNCSGYLASIVGFPAVTLPIGNLKNGIGLGIQMVSGANSDASLLSLAFGFEQNLSLRALPETAPDLYEGAENTKVETEQNPTEQAPQKDEIEETPKPSPLWQKIAVAVIIISVLAICTYIMLTGKNKKQKKSRNF